MSSVLVLSCDYNYMSIIGWQKAITLVYSNKAETLKESDRIIRSPSVSMRIPLVIRLLKFVRQIYKNKVPCNRNNIFIRDNFTCQYCGKQASKSKLTLDHVVPESKKGDFTWENLVCCCEACNFFKDDRTPKQAGMSLLKKPVQPTISEFILRAVKDRNILDFLESLFGKINTK